MLSLIMNPPMSSRRSSRTRGIGLSMGSWSNQEKRGQRRKSATRVLWVDAPELDGTAPTVGGWRDRWSALSPWAVHAGVSAPATRRRTGCHDAPAGEPLATHGLGWAGDFEPAGVYATLPPRLAPAGPGLLIRAPRLVVSEIASLGVAARVLLRVGRGRRGALAGTGTG